jgi:hypothetical protein
LGERIQKPGLMLSATNNEDTLLDDLKLLTLFDHIVEKTQHEGSVCKDPWMMGTVVNPLL